MIYVMMITRGDRNELLKRAVSSVLSQVGAEFKLLLCENGATIADLSVLALLDDPRVQRVPVATMSVAQARNHMAAMAGPNDQLIVVDDDDYLLPNALRDLLAAMPKGGLAYGDCQVDRGDGKLWKRHNCSVPFSKENMLKVSCIFHPALFAKSLFTRLNGLDESLPLLQQYDFFLRLSELPDALKLVYHLQRPLYVFNDTPGHASTRSQPERAQWLATVRERAVARRAAMGG